MAEHLRVTVDHHVGRVVMDRAPVNALTPRVFDELTETFRAFAGDRDVRVVVLASAHERAWCAGVDIKGWADAPDVVLHCTFPEHLPIAEVHQRSGEIERALRAELGAFGSVLVHAEPRG